MAQDFGTMTGMVNGLKEGLLAYQTNKQIQRQQGVEDLLKGVQQNPTTGSYEYTPQKLAQMQMEQKKLQAESQQYDPESAYSKQMNTAYGGLLGADKSQSLQGLSAEQLKNMSPAIIAGIKHTPSIPIDDELVGKKKSLLDAQINKYNAETNRLREPKPENPTLGLRQDIVTARATDKINSDAALNVMKNQGRQMDKAQDLLNQPNVAMKTLAEVGQDIAGALSGKTAASDFKMKQVEIDNIQTELANAQAKWLSNPNTPAPKEVVDFWRNMATRLNEGIDKQVESRAREFGSSLEDTYKHTPQAIDAVRKKIDYHKAGQWRRSQSEPEASATPGLIQQQPKTAKPSWAL